MIIYHPWRMLVQLVHREGNLYNESLGSDRIYDEFCPWLMEAKDDGLLGRQSIEAVAVSRMWFLGSCMFLHVLAQVLVCG